MLDPAGPMAGFPYGSDGSGRAGVGEDGIEGVGVPVEVDGGGSWSRSSSSIEGKSTPESGVVVDSGGKTFFEEVLFFFLPPSKMTAAPPTSRSGSGLAMISTRMCFAGIRSA